MKKQGIILSLVLLALIQNNFTWCNNSLGLSPEDSNLVDEALVNQVRMEVYRFWKMSTDLYFLATNNNEASLREANNESLKQTMNSFYENVFVSPDQSPEVIDNVTLHNALDDIINGIQTFLKDLKISIKTQLLPNASLKEKIHYVGLLNRSFEKYYYTFFQSDKAPNFFWGSYYATYFGSFLYSTTLIGSSYFFALKHASALINKLITSFIKSLGSMDPKDEQQITNLLHKFSMMIIVIFSGAVVIQGAKFVYNPIYNAQKTIYQAHAELKKTELRYRTLIKQKQHALNKKYLPHIFLPADQKERMFLFIEQALNPCGNKNNVSQALLLVGPPGTGKSTLAQAIISTINSKLPEGYRFQTYDLRAHDFSEEKFNWIITQIERSPLPSIVFIDEVDCIIGESRFGDKKPSIEEKERLSFLLQTLDDIVGKTKGNNIFIFTSNKTDLDKALIRDGRISNIEYVDYPDENQRKDIILHNLHKNNIALHDSFSIDELVTMTLTNAKKERLAGSDIEALIAKAANLVKWRYGRERKMHGSLRHTGITKEDFELAKLMRQI